MTGSAPETASTASNVTRLTMGGKELFLVGTAHVSKKSVEEVTRVIEELRPDSVCVELDPVRYETLTDETRWRRLDVLEILRGDRAGLFLASLLFSGFQKRLGDRLGVRPGTEMLAAVEAARRIGAQVVLADRDIQATLMRCYRSLGTIDRAKIVAVLGMLPFAAADIDEAQVEELKNRETMGDMMATFAREMPALETPLISERDRYLMASVEAAPGARVVAVVGAAHVGGMAKNHGIPADRAALCVVPEETLASRLLAWWPLAAFMLLGALAVLRGASLESAAALLLRAALAPAFVAMLFALAAGATLPAAAVTWVLAPVSLVAPGIGLGRLAGLVQARTRPPTADDGANLRSDVLVPRRARNNPFVRALLVAVAASFGRSAGAALGFAWALWRVLFH